MSFASLKKYLLNHREKVIFFLLSVLILAPLLRPGFVLTLDMIFTPEMQIIFPPSSGAYSLVIRDVLSFLITRIIPAEIFEKLVLLFLFYLIPTGFYKFLSVFDSRSNKLQHTSKNFWLKILASTLYLWNPFVYSRLMAGHWAFLSGYALIPFFLILLSKAYSDPKAILKNAIFAGSLWFLASILSPHHFVLFGILFLIFSAVSIAKGNANSFKTFILTFALSIIFNSIWIIPSLLPENGFKGFNQIDLLLFASSPDSTIGVLGNLLTMYGFWAEKTLLFLPKNILSFWPVPFLVLLVPILILVPSLFPERLRKILNIKDKFTAENKIYITLGIAVVLGIFLSLGSFGIAKPVYDFLYIKFPILSSFREPQKFLSLYVLGFCFFFYEGFKLWIKKLSLEKFEQKKFSPAIQKVLIFEYFLLIFCLTFTLFWGAAGQLKTTSYPDSWEKLNNLVERQERILVLPYQSYALFKFNNRRIANPSPHYFSAVVISKQEIIETDASECDVVVGNSCLNKSDSEDVWRKALRSEGVEYILVNKNDDWKEYNFISSSSDFAKIIEDEYAYVLKVN